MTSSGQQNVKKLGGQEVKSDAHGPTVQCLEECHFELSKCNGSFTYTETDSDPCPEIEPCSENRCSSHLEMGSVPFCMQCEYFCMVHL